MESAVCTISMRRTYLGQEEEIAVGISMTYPLSDPHTRIEEIVDTHVGAMRDALEEATLRALNSEYPLASNDAIDLPDTETQSLFEPENEPDDSPDMNVVFDEDDREELPDAERVLEEDPNEAESASTDVPDPHPDVRAESEQPPADPKPIPPDLVINRSRQILVASEAKRIGIDEQSLVVLLVDLYRKPSLACLKRSEADALLSKIRDGSVLTYVNLPALAEAAT